MRYEFIAEFNRQYEKHFEMERKAAKEVMDYFINEVIPKAPEILESKNLKLYELSQWILDNSETLNELNMNVNDCFRNFCEEFYDIGNYMLNKKGIQRKYLDSSSSFIYTTQDMTEEQLRLLKTLQERNIVSWPYIEYVTCRGMDGIANGFNIYNIKYDNYRETMYEVVLENFNDEFTLREIQNIVKQNVFWHTFNENLKQSNFKKDITSLIEINDELKKFKKNSIVDFLYYIQKTLQLECRYTYPEAIERLKEDMDIVGDLIKKEKCKLEENA